jgi:nucleotide-binding universal stress UspA family protein
MYQHILVPLDGSELSAAVLPHAEGLARRLTARIKLVRAANLPASVLADVDPMGGPLPADLIEGALEAEVDDAKSYLTQVSEGLKGAGIDVTWEVVEGDPARAIIDAALKNNCDLISMATHGRSGLERMVLGSVADRVLRDSHLPVLMVHPPVPAPTP